jgi:hypothetical protein
MLPSFVFYLCCVAREKSCESGKVDLQDTSTGVGGGGAVGRLVAARRNIPIPMKKTGHLAQAAASRNSCSIFSRLLPDLRVI